MTALNVQLNRIAQTPRLLIACDYDGVVAPIVADPTRAVPDPAAMECLDRLSAIRQTDIAIVSGRSIQSLQTFVGQRPRWHMVGCHGAEWPSTDSVISSQSLRDELHRFSNGLHELARETPGLSIEVKPSGLALHYRHAPPEAVGPLLSHAMALAAGHPEFVVRHGKMVVEFSATSINKGHALKRLRHITGASAVIFIGDDVTDEDAFLSLGDSDIGVSVGGARRGASFEIPDPRDVVERLNALVLYRAEWDTRTRCTPIQHHSMLSDQRCIALVDPHATINWLCLPRMDSPSMFGSLLGMHTPPSLGQSTNAGHFSIAPENSAEAGRQEYIAESMILRTEWPNVTVTDYLDCSGGRPYQRAGSSDLIRVVEGKGRVRIEFAPRLDFGRTVTTLALRPNGLVMEGQPDPLSLYAPGIQWTIQMDGPHQTAVASLELTPGQPRVLELRYGTANFRDAIAPEPRRRAQTQKFWDSWAASLHLPSVAPDAVRRSAIILKALAYGPTGAIIAAPTTSLPEWLGGIRNWDYRYCWPRDAALAATALVRLGNNGHGMRLLDWLLGIIDFTQSPERLRPIYTVSGRELGPEADISDLSGFADSRPVRISNAASGQVQLDVFGPIVNLAYSLAHAGAPVSPDHWRLVEAMVKAVERRWQEPDNGIWEIRGLQRHYTHSKAMCWFAVDRAVRLADIIFGKHEPDWDVLAQRIADETLTRGWDDELGGFRVAYDVAEFDTSALLIGLSGLVALDDARFRRTIENVERFSRVNSAVYRYRFDDGLPGCEGGFLLCLGWLIEAYALTGEVVKAEELFSKFLECAGPTGLFAEQVDPHTGGAVGNFPQAYSHLALINAAVTLDEIKQGRDISSPPHVSATTT